MSLPPVIVQLLLAGGAVLLALWIDVRTERRGWLPPGFRIPAIGQASPWPALLRRLAGVVVLAMVLWIGVLGSLATLGAAPEIDPSRLSVPRLFALHVLLLVALAVWLTAGYLRLEGGVRGWLRAVVAQLGLRCRRPAVELGLGLGTGLLAWAAVLLAMIATASILGLLGGEQWLPEQPPAVMSWVVGLPVGVRLAVACSAGLVEEGFFRGFLQPRIGVLLSTGLFVLAHLSWGQPIMLLGVALLSLVFAGLVRWRQSIWAAVTAHAVFDAVQLLIVLPVVFRISGSG